MASSNICELLVSYIWVCICCTVPVIMAWSWSVPGYAHTRDCASIQFKCRVPDLDLTLSFFGGGGGALSAEDIRGPVRSVLEHVQSYEITYPRWLQPLRRRRSANQEVSQSVPLTPLAKYFWIKLSRLWECLMKNICVFFFVFFSPPSIPLRHWFWLQLRARSSH